MNNVWILFLLMLSTIFSTEAQSADGGRCVTTDGRLGTCVSILSCPFMRSLLIQVSLGNADFSEIRRSICRLEKEPYVCCASESTLNDAPSNPFPPNISPVSATRPTMTDRRSLLPEKCGLQGLSDRIIAGQPAPLGAWPWMVLLRGKIDGRSTWHCGGTLISDRYVITAAHCLNDRFGVELEFVRVGELTIGQNPDCTPFGRCAPSPQDIPVERIIRHPSYNIPCSECNDIALLRLSRKVTLHRRYVQPICLPVNPREDMGFSVQEYQGKAAWAAGWGTISQDPRKPVRTDILRQVQLPIDDLPACDTLKRTYPDESMVLCAGGDGRDTCRGDSGGPLALTSNVGSTYFLVGITSKGPVLCGTQSTQGIYTSVHHYIPWIVSNLQP